jgi:hypothetical protein
MRMEEIATAMMQDLQMAMTAIEALTASLED